MGRRINKNNNQTARSGAKKYHDYGSDKGLKIWCWKYVNGVMWKGWVRRTEKQAEIAPSKSKKGNEWVSVLLTLDAPLNNTVFCYGMYNINSGIAHFPTWDWQVNPNARNGGYFGRKPDDNR